MTKSLGKKLAVLLSAAVVAGSFTGCGLLRNTEIVFTTGLSGNQLFKIGKSVCTLPEAMIYVMDYQRQYEGVYGVETVSYTHLEIASQFFVMGFAAGVIAIIFKLNGMTINGMASAFQGGVADLAGTAVVVGMAKGILLVLGGSDADVYSTLNTILYAIGNALEGIPSFIGAWFMYIFQSLSLIHILDAKDTTPEKLVFNRIVSLKSSFKLPKA